MLVIDMNKTALKPNYFKKQSSLSSFLLTEGNNTSPNWPGVLSRLVAMHLRQETGLLRTLLPFQICIISLGKVKMMTKNIAS